MNRRNVKKRIASILHVPIRTISEIKENKTGMYSIVYTAKVGDKNIVLKQRLRNPLDDWLEFFPYSIRG